MPTKTYKPALGTPSGYEADLAFSDAQLEELADLLALPSAIIARPLNKVAAAIGVFRYTLRDDLTPAVNRATLSEAAKHADNLLAIMRELNSHSRQCLLIEYAGGPVPDS